MVTSHTVTSQRVIIPYTTHQGGVPPLTRPTPPLTRPRVSSFLSPRSRGGNRPVKPRFLALSLLGCIEGSFLCPLGTAAS